jgi:xanthine/CO dehydrogenase XdhC/CoxF family maturation factor
VTTQYVQRTVGGNQPEYAVSDEAVEQMDEQPHRQCFFPNTCDLTGVPSPVLAYIAERLQ